MTVRNGNVYLRVTFATGMPEFELPDRRMYCISTIAARITQFWGIECGIYFGKGTWQGKIEDCVKFECVLLDGFVGASPYHDIEYLCHEIRRVFDQDQVLVMTDDVSVSLYPPEILKKL